MPLPILSLSSIRHFSQGIDPDIGGTLAESTLMPFTTSTLVTNLRRSLRDSSFSSASQFLTLFIQFIEQAFHFVMGSGR